MTRDGRNSGIPGGRDSARGTRAAGFTLVEVLVALGILAGLACAVAGAAAACRAAGERARREADGARVLADLYAAARTEGPGAVAEVPGEEGRWAVVGTGGARTAVGDAGAGAERWRIEAMERTAGGVEAVFDVHGEPEAP